MKAPALYRYWANKIILASDGYQRLLSTLKEMEEHLQKLRREDPVIIDQYMAAKGVCEDAKSFDDRTYLRI
jgi:glycerophosphoryl diester phosphodiesterase